MMGKRIKKIQKLYDPKSLSKEFWAFISAYHIVTSYNVVDL